MNYLLVALLLQAINFSPGDEINWQTPCVIQKSDSTNVVEQLAQEYLIKIQVDLKVVRCVQPRNFVTPVLRSKRTGLDLLLIYSEEMEDLNFDRLALHGLIAHEIAHIVESRACSSVFYRQPSRQEYLDCESSVDRLAAWLSSADAVKAALKIYYRLCAEMAGRELIRVRQDTINERLELLESNED